MDSREALVAMNMIDGLGPVRVRQLLEHFGEPAAILSANRSQLERVNGIGPELSNTIANWQKDVDLAGEMKRIEQFDCKIVIGTDEVYPAPLKQIYDRPFCFISKTNSPPMRDEKSVPFVPVPFFQVLTSAVF